MNDTAATENAEENLASQEEADRTVDMAALRAELATLQEQYAHCTEQWKRCEAELQNFRKRVDKERGDWIQSGLASLVTRLLPVLDDLERAFAALPPELGQLTWVEGMALVERKLQLTLEQQGLKEIESVGTEFDPTKHQVVVEQETSSVPEGHVMAVLQKGYTFNSRVLRPALVQVARAPSSSTVEANDSTREEPSDEEQNSA